MKFMISLPLYALRFGFSAIYAYMYGKHGREAPKNVSEDFLPRVRGERSKEDKHVVSGLRVYETE